MSTAVFPSTLPGFGENGYQFSRTPKYQTRRAQSVSGKETRLADWAYPRYQYEVRFVLLRQNPAASLTEYAALHAFFSNVKGGFDSFLFLDPDDSTVTTQGLGSGDGAATVFPLVRAFGGNVAPVLAPDLTPVAPKIYVGGVLQSSGYAITYWNTTDSHGPGQVIFDNPPGVSVPITADFTYKWPCRFDDDEMTFEKFLAARYRVKGVTFTTIK